MGATDTCYTEIGAEVAQGVAVFMKGAVLDDVATRLVVETTLATCGLGGNKLAIIFAYEGVTGLKLEDGSECVREA